MLYYASGNIITFLFITCLIMNKTTHWYNAVIETAENNYYIELEKIWTKKYKFSAYSEWDEIRGLNYKIEKLKKWKFTECILDFLNAFKIKDFNFMEY